MTTADAGGMWSASRIRSFRDARGWSQERLARQIGVAVATVSRWETEEQRPSPLAVAKLDELASETAVSE